MATPVCDGIPTCEIRQISDAACTTPLQYTETNNQTSLAAYVTYYTPTPPLEFLASNCGNSRAEFFDLNWNLVHTSPIINNTAGACVVQNNTNTPNLILVMLLSQIGSNETITFKRSQPINTVFFSRLVSASSVDNNTATIQVQLTPTYNYPYCCAFPQSFYSNAYIFNRTLASTTCGVDDVVTYTLRSRSPTTITEINSTYVLWTFDISRPTNESCGLLIDGDELTDPFVVSIVVKKSNIPVVPTNIVSPTGYDISAVVISIVVPVVLLLLWAIYVIRTRQKTYLDVLNSK